MLSAGRRWPDFSGSRLAATLVSLDKEFQPIADRQLVDAALASGPDMDEDIDVAIVGPDETESPFLVVQNHFPAQHAFPSLTRGNAALINSPASASARIGGNAICATAS